MSGDLPSWQLTNSCLRKLSVLDQVLEGVENLSARFDKLSEGRGAEGLVAKSLSYRHEYIAGGPGGLMIHAPSER